MLSQLSRVIDIEILLLKILVLQLLYKFQWLHYLVCLPCLYRQHTFELNDYMLSQHYVTMIQRTPEKTKN